jgi:hypothetical protein
MRNDQGIDAIVMACNYDVMDHKQTTVRIPADLAAEAEAVARVRGTSLNAVILESLRAEIDKARNDKAFVDRAKELIARDRELLKRLAQ